MADVNVDFTDLMALQADLQKAAAGYQEVLVSISGKMNSIIGSEWEDEVSTSFQTVFNQSEKDFRQLQELMAEFSQFLQGKAEILQIYHQSKLSI